ncbi:MAG: sodium:proton exchanger [Actinomycetota bacterium]
MTTLQDDLHNVHPARQRMYLALAIVVTVPGVVVRFLDPGLPHPLEAALFGMAIVGAAFLLSWGAEAAQLDISAGLAIAVLAFIAVLPEYAVDLVFASKAGNAVQEFGAACGPPGSDPESTPCSLALANMTGANRLLIGIGWSLVVFLAWYQVRRFRRRETEGTLDAADRRALVGQSGTGIELERSHAVEVSFLALATLYSLTLPLKHSITLIDAGVLITIFVAYTIRISRAPAEEPHLVGPARYVGTFSDGRRRLSVVAMFVFAATIILLSAEHFAEALVASGETLGISEFVLVQWLAPLASEAPELLIAGLYAWRLNTNAGLGTLVSSKVNQWTLLVGTLPIVFAMASASSHGLPLGALQREELFLTAAQSFFAVAVLSSLSLSNREALMLFGLFWAQFILGAVVPESLVAAERIGVGILYLVLGAVVLMKDRGQIRRLLRDGFRTPFSEMMEDEPAADPRTSTPAPGA